MTPASMPPAGVPHCLMEKISGCQRGGDTRANTWLPAGFIDAVEKPITIAPSRAQSGCARLISKVPVAVKSRAN